MERTMNQKLPLLRELFLCFFKIGLFTFGGGYAMIAIIHDACVDQKKWITHDEMMDITVIAESTPGPIAINCATYVGYKTAGFAGAMAATLGVVLPSFVILYTISMFLEDFLEYPAVASAFKGIKVAVGILIVDAGLTMAKKMKRKPLTLVIAGCAFAIMLTVNLFALRLSSITLMLLAGSVSLALFLAKEKGGGVK